MPNIMKMAADALQDKALELVDERNKVRRRLLEDAIRDQQIDRDLTGCIAGAKALGFDIEIPNTLPPNPHRANALTHFASGRTSLSNAYQHLRADYGITDGELEEGDDAPLEIPRIADIILDRLKVAGEDGSKAAAIRGFILHTYKADIHEKTVGMTLYRLQKEEKVRRDGHTWFLVP